MKKMQNFEIIKYSGERAQFSVEKLKKSLLKSGAGDALVAEIVNIVRDELYQGISTREIYNRAYALLKKEKRIFASRSEEHTSELQSRENLVCRLLLEKKNKKKQT